MRILFFDKVICEGTAEECEAFKSDLLDTLSKLDDELKDTYPMKETDTYQTYFEALKVLNPFAYETLSYLKEIAGDYFIEFRFRKMGLVGISMRVYADLETKRTKVYSLAFIYNIFAFDLTEVAIFKIEE